VRLKRKSEGTPYERWGGQPFFDALVEQFYVGVATDPLLRPMYPDDLTESKVHLALFLGQYWGGPDVYNQIRGHPRLRMRHTPFVIGRTEAEAWMRHMTAAVDAMGMGADDRTELLDYLSMAARSLQNAH
jgi:hemoglobin